jgi:hypothetical protein
VSLKPGLIPSAVIEAKVAKAIETQIGKIARPKNLCDRLVDGVGPDRHPPQVPQVGTGAERGAARW